MSSTDVADAVAKLQNLSQERADRVLSLIEDLAELEALEDAEDLKEAREVLAETRPTISFDQLRRELGLDRSCTGSS